MPQSPATTAFAKTATRLLSLAALLSALSAAGSALATQTTPPQPETQGTTATAAQTQTSTAKTEAAAPQPLSREQARTFLAHYPGTWEGNSTVQSIDGQFRTVISVRIEYQFDPQKPEEISGRAVFAIGEHTVFATSRTYYSEGALHCVIERDGLQELFVGRVNAEANSVTWRSQDRPNALQSYSKETFTPAASGQPSQMITEGYEDYRDQGAIMTQKTVLSRTAPAATTPATATN